MQMSEVQMSEVQARETAKHNPPTPIQSWNIHVGPSKLMVHSAVSERGQSAQHRHALTLPGDPHLHRLPRAPPEMPSLYHPQHARPEVIMHRGEDAALETLESSQSRASRTASIPFEYPLVLHLKLVPRS